MRINRALEKLRKFFSKRGVTFSGAVIAGAISTHSVQAAPMGLASSVTAGVVKGTPLAGSTITLMKSTLKYMTWLKLKSAAVISGIAIVSIGTATVAVQHSVAATQEVRPGFAGYASPEATLKSMIWALSIGDQKEFEAACTPEEAERFRNRMAGQSAEEFKKVAKATASQFAKYRINGTVVVSDTEVHLHVEALAGDGSQKGDAKPIMKMQKIGSQWKYAGDLGSHGR